MSFIQKLFERSPEPDSLPAVVQRPDVVEQLLRDAVRGYQGLIDLIGSHVPKAAREIGQDHKKRLKQIRNLLESNPSKPLMGDVHQQLDKTIAGFARELDQQLGQQEKETKQVMAIIAVVAESMADREKQYNVRFRGIGKKLRVLSTSNDIAEIRRKLEAEVCQLEKYCEEMARDTDSAVSRVQMELRQAKKVDPLPQPVEEDAFNFSGSKAKPAVAATAEIRDQPTPLVGRREAEKAVESRRRLDSRFCAARFSIDNMPDVAAQFGLPAAAGLMEQIGSLIRQRFEPLDLVCGWSDQDLVVITDLGLPEVAMRVADLDPILEGPYATGNREVTLKVRSCVIERTLGERGLETIGRIESMLVSL